MRNCSGKLLTLSLLCCALLRLLPLGDSENIPLPFSAASVFFHGIASPLPAVSESGKVETPSPSQTYLSSSYHVYVGLPLAGLLPQPKPTTNVSSSCDACMLSCSVELLNLSSGYRQASVCLLCSDLLQWLLLFLYLKAYICILLHFQ